MGFSATPDKTKREQANWWARAVDMLTDFFDVGTITIAPGEVTVAVSAGEAGELYQHLFKRPDGSQVVHL